MCRVTRHESGEGVVALGHAGDFKTAIRGGFGKKRMGRKQDVPIWFLSIMNGAVQLSESGVTPLDRHWTRWWYRDIEFPSMIGPRRTGCVQSLVYRKKSERLSTVSNGDGGCEAISPNLDQQRFHRDFGRCSRNFIGDVRERARSGWPS